MILDKLEALDFYGPLIPHYPRIAAFLKSWKPDTLEPGRYDIAGDDAYALLQHYETAPEQDKKWESHRRHLDIQIVLHGREHIGWADAGGLDVVEPYRDEKDVMFYRDPARSVAVLMEPGSFCVFYPRDAHRPGCHAGEPGSVVKAVVKVRLPDTE